MLTMQERLWRAMRIQRFFDLGKLKAATESSLDTTRRYTLVLCRAGFLIARRRNDTFVLVRDTGPRPPKVLYRTDPGTHTAIGVYDRNTDTGYGLDGNPPPALVRPEKVKRPAPRRPRRIKAVAR
ncbi:MAG: hypothetical protein Q8M19_17265 [Reyranella sp.]|nr:hypothetical protein [Reyranella sp.]